jgi:hypothetical protein
MSESINQNARTWAALELALLIILWTLTIWGPWLWTGISAWTLAGVGSMLATVCLSLLLRRPGWRNSGLSFIGFWPGIRWAGFLTLCFLAVSLFLWGVADVQFPALSASMVAGTFVSGILQEAFFLGYVLQRWNDALQSWRTAVLANALQLGWIHLPDPGLVAVSTLGGLLFGVVFMRVRNVWGFGLAHGVFSLLTLPLLLQVGLIKTMRVGPPDLAWFVKTIESEMEPGDQIWIGSQNLDRKEFVRDLKLPVDTVKDDSDFRRLESLLAAAKPRVFLVVREKDLDRYWSRRSLERLFTLTERDEWRLYFSSENEAPFFSDRRDRVLLVSNQSLKHPLPRWRLPMSAMKNEGTHPDHGAVY